jgi:hypothetical protein
MDDARSLCVPLVSCSRLGRKTSLVYLGFDVRSKRPEKVIELLKTWSSSPPCPHWLVTIDPRAADYRVMVGDVDITIIDRQGQVIYSGGPGVMYDSGNTDRSGVNVCKLTGE